MKADGKGKAPYTENINRHVPSGWCIHSTFAYGDVPDPLKMYRRKAAVCNFSTAAYYRTYQCVEKRTRGNGKVSHLSQRVQ